MKIAKVLFLPVIFLSCSKKTEQVAVPFSEASYKVAVTLNWTSPAFGVPAGAHVTALTGMVHNKDTFLWKPGKLSSPGLEDVAEIGNSIKINQEIDDILIKSKALSKFNISPPLPAGTIETNLIFNTNYSYVSFASMIAPSPDWFMGIHDLNLLNNKVWVNDTTLNLMVYDAGTEDGDVFDYNNPETTPQQSIGLLTPANASVFANGNSNVVPIGVIRFTKN